MCIPGTNPILSSDEDMLEVEKLRRGCWRGARRAVRGETKVRSMYVVDVETAAIVS